MAAAPAILKGQQGALTARIKIDTERVIGDIDPKIYGNFIEHLGRCIDGGIFEEKSPLSDANGFRKDVMDAVRKAERHDSAVAGRQLLVKLPLEGRDRAAGPAPAAAGDGMGHRGEQPLRHARIPAIRRDAGHPALHLLQPGHRLVDRCPAMGGILQLLGRHRHDPAAQAERAERSLEGSVLGTRQRDGRSLADGPPQRGGLRQIRAGGRQADEVDRSQRQADRGGRVQFPAGRRTGRSGTGPSWST